MLLASCIDSSMIKGNGKVAKGAFDVRADYTELSVSSAITVVFAPVAEVSGGASMVEGHITADEEVLEFVSIVDDEGRIRISYEPFVAVRSDIKTVVTIPVSTSLGKISANSAAKVSCEVKLVCPSLAIDCSSAAEMDLQIEAKNLDMELSSAAIFKGAVSVAELDVDMTSAAKCRMEGTADEADMDVTSAAAFNGYDLVCRKAELDASSAGKIDITVSDELDAEVSSGGAVRYHGAPALVRRDVSSGGSIKSVE